MVEKEKRSIHVQTVREGGAARVMIGRATRRVIAAIAVMSGVALAAQDDLASSEVNGGIGPDTVEVFCVAFRTLLACFIRFVIVRCNGEDEKSS